MSNNIPTRGYLTLAIGDRYRHLATVLVKSYRLNSKNIPFAVITDNSNEIEEGLFDDIIIVDNNSRSYLNKLDVYNLSPYDETIFIDADCIVVKDISDWFSVFKKNGCEVSVWGDNIGLNDERHKKLLSTKAIELFDINRYIDFNGGVYYFEKSEKAEKVFALAKEYVNNYTELGLHMFGDKPGDEPVMELAMLMQGMYGATDYERNKMFCTPGMSKLRIDVLKNYCECFKYESKVYPSVLHWGTSKTSFPLYKREALKICLSYRKMPVFFCKLIPFLYYQLLRVYQQIWLG